MSGGFTAGGVKEQAAPVRKTTRKRLGHWRNRWKVPPRYDAHVRREGALPLGDGTYLGGRKFPTRKAALDYARPAIDDNRRLYDTHYLGQEFFPDY